MRTRMQMMTSGTGFFAAAAAALLVLASFGAADAKAATVEIQFTGLQLSYDSGRLESVAGSELATIDFFLDDDLVGSFDETDGVLSPDFDVDIMLPADGAFSDPGGSGILDLTLLGGAYSLNLDVENFAGFVGSNTRSLFVEGDAGVFDQNLPFMLVFDQPQQISFMVSSANISNVVTDGNGDLVSFNARATGSILGSGYLVPEPTAGLLLVGGAMLLATRRRRACA